MRHPDSQCRGAGCPHGSSTLSVTVSSVPHSNRISADFPPANPLSLRVQHWPWHGAERGTAQPVWPGSFPGKWEAGSETTETSPRLQQGANGQVSEAVTAVRSFTPERWGSRHQDCSHTHTSRPVPRRWRSCPLSAHLHTSHRWAQSVWERGGARSIRPTLTEHLLCVQPWERCSGAGQ